MKETDWVTGGFIFDGGGFGNGIFANYNTINQEDLQELKGMKTRKIVFTKNEGKFKEGDVVDAKIITNKRTSEPPSFLVIEETIGSPKIGFGGRGSVEFFRLMKEAPITDTKTLNGGNLTDSNSNKNSDNLNNSKPKEPLFYVLVTIGVLTLGYFAYNKLKK
jgi:hypothetical protein